jgi:hypothetical protein
MTTTEPKKRGRPRIIRPSAEPKTIGRPRLIGKRPLSARDAHAIAMARFGITPADIATALRISHGAACCILSRARTIHGAEIPKQPAGRRALPRA